MKITFPETFSKEHAEQYILNIYFDLYRKYFSFSLYNPAENGSYFYKAIPAESRKGMYDSFSQFYFDNEYLSLPYGKIVILFCSGRYTYVPGLLYEESAREDLMDFNFSPSEKEKTFCQKMKNPDMDILFKVPEDLYQFIQRSFPNPEIIHQTSGLISYFGKTGKIINSNKMIVNFRESSMDILCFSYDKFVLGNSFSYHTEEDSEYFTLFLWQQLKFNQEKDFLYVSGFHKSKAGLIEALKPYLKNIVPANIEAFGHFYGTDTEEIPFELSILSLCEL